MWIESRQNGCNESAWSKHGTSEGKCWGSAMSICRRESTCQRNRGNFEHFNLRRLGRFWTFSANYNQKTFCPWRASQHCWSCSSRSSYPSTFSSSSDFLLLFTHTFSISSSLALFFLFCSFLFHISQVPLKRFSLSLSIYIYIPIALSLYIYIYISCSLSLSFLSIFLYLYLCLCLHLCVFILNVVPVCPSPLFLLFFSPDLSANEPAQNGIGTAWDWLPMPLVGPLCQCRPTTLPTRKITW